jgi:anti-sigma regulatory factor (Ser/Thr protein kinase)
MDGLAEAIAFVETFCREHGLAHEASLRLSLIVEELFTNTVVHGHGGDCDEPVRIGLEAGLSQVALMYEDSAPPFDPLDHLARCPIDLEAGAADRQIGRLGIALVVSLAVHASYTREDGCNRLRLALRRQE